MSRPAPRKSSLAGLNPLTTQPINPTTNTTNTDYGDKTGDISIDMPNAPSQDNTAIVETTNTSPDNGDSGGAEADSKEAENPAPTAEDREGKAKGKPKASKSEAKGTKKTGGEKSRRVKASLIVDPDVLAQARTAFLLSMPDTGARNFSEWTQILWEKEIRKVEKTYNQGKPLRHTPTGSLPTGYAARYPQ